MQKRSFPVAFALIAALSLFPVNLSARGYWNEKTQLKPFALPMPAVGAPVERLDLNGDARADIQFVFDYTVPGGPAEWRSPHYMVFLDDDKDGVMNYIDWNDMALKCWEKNGLSDFYPDYNGDATFMKVHTTTLNCMDLRFNWENPFLFYDYDGDGLTEMAVRFVDECVKEDAEALSKGITYPQYRGRQGWFSFGIDLDNDNCPGNDIDFDMTLHYLNDEGGGFHYTDQVHPLKNMRGLPEADRFFPDPRVRQLTELVYPDRDKAIDMAFAGRWKCARFCYDEDDDCSRWERVELYDNRDPFVVGSRKGGLDHNPQADPSGDRGEWDDDFSGGGDIYIGRFDGRIHLYGAERGVWRIDQNTNFYQGFNRTFQNMDPSRFATVEYLDTDGNGFFDTFNYDIDGDKAYEWTVSLKELGLDDTCEVIDVSKMHYKDYQKLFRKVSRNMWKNAVEAVKAAEKAGLTTFWYSHLLQPLTARERYHDGWWLQFYLFKDMEYKFLLDAAEGNKETGPEMNDLYRARFSGNWKILSK